MRILAIDPGSTESGYLYFDNEATPQFAGSIIPNVRFIKSLPLAKFDVCAIEMIASYGMGVGKEVFDTCVWIGRMIQASPIEPILVYRKDIKIHFCQTARATDANIRYAILDRFGGKEKAIGKKGCYGPLRSIKGHLWSALAIALFVQDTLPVSSNGEAPSLSVSKPK